MNIFHITHPRPRFTTMNESTLSSAAVSQETRPEVIKLQPRDLFSFEIHKLKTTGIVGSFELKSGLRGGFEKTHGLLINHIHPDVHYFLHNNPNCEGSGPAPIERNGKLYRYSWSISAHSEDCRNFILGDKEEPVKPPTNIEKAPLITPVKLNFAGYLLLRDLLLHKNGKPPRLLYGDIDKYLYKLAPNYRKRFAWGDSHYYYDLFLGGGVKSSGYIIANPLNIHREGIGDCGYGALGGVDSLTAHHEDKDQINFSLLIFFITIEIGLANAGYLLCSARLTSGRMLIPQMKILKRLGELSECFVPIMNPHMEDHNLANPYSRERFFILITHAGLKKYYQSEEFKALDLKV